MPANSSPPFRTSFDFRLDAMAIAVSVLCIVHCIGSIMALALLSGIGGLLLADNVHHVGLGVALLLGSLALGFGFRHHRRRLPMLLGLGGLMLMATALLLPHGWPEAAVTIAGTSLLASGHWHNMRGRPARA